MVLLSACAQAAVNRVLILSGSGKHDARLTTPHLRTILERTGKFEVRINEEAAGIAAATLAGYDAVVLDSVKTSPAIDAYVRSGKGLVVVHAGEACGEKRLYRVKLHDSKHSVTDGLGESFTTSDQLHLKPTLPSDAVVLASAEMPVAWTYMEGKGRVFYTTLGHSLAARQEPAVESMLARAVEWAAAGKVVPAVSSATPIRALVVTGGHGYGTSFYTIFDPSLVWKHAVNNAEAFDKDIRDRYDVLILYNMTDEISEAGKKNLVAFVEAGKGVVVLHHAVFSFRNWEWWREEVTGTRPMPKDRRPPGPGYQHDVDLVIESASKHPITEGLAPMHIVDETYLTLEFSPKAQILLKTDHPTSNGPVAWLGTHTKSRVVTIQLGHDHTSHLHAGFRTLVQRAILWSVKKL